MKLGPWRYWVKWFHPRNGEYSHEDQTRFNTYRVEVMVPSWSQYVLQAERLTKAENIILERVRSFHVRSASLSEQMFLCVNKELHNKRHQKTSSAVVPDAPAKLSNSEEQPRS